MVKSGIYAISGGETVFLATVDDFLNDEETQEEVVHDFQILLNDTIGDLVSDPDPEHNKAVVIIVIIQ